ncbi:MAG: DUF5522 domain-containing protein [Chitinophagaceae bacterium]
MKKELKEGIDFYYNDNGQMVLTETYHLQQGFCCGNGCMHCPYEYENVPEPKKSSLLQQKFQNKD